MAKSLIDPGGMRARGKLPTQTMDVMTKEAVQKAAPDIVIKVDLDDRAFLFPAAKPLAQLHLLVYRPYKVRFECAYPFNETRHTPELFELSAAETHELLRHLVDTVYRARSSQMVTRTTSLTINVVTNGYIIQFGDHEQPRELMLSTGCIWRVAGAIARAVDFQLPISSN